MIDYKWNGANVYNKLLFKHLNLESKKKVNL